MPRGTQRQRSGVGTPAFRKSPCGGTQAQNAEAEAFLSRVPRGTQSQRSGVCRLAWGSFGHPQPPVVHDRHWSVLWPNAGSCGGCSGTPSPQWASTATGRSSCRKPARVGVVRAPPAPSGIRPPLVGLSAESRLVWGLFGHPGPLVGFDRHWSVRMPAQFLLGGGGTPRRKPPKSIRAGVNFTSCQTWSRACVRELFLRLWPTNRLTFKN